MIPFSFEGVNAIKKVKGGRALENLSSPAPLQEEKIKESQREASPLLHN
jgi:hypothetical protein